MMTRPRDPLNRLRLPEPPDAPLWSAPENPLSPKETPSDGPQISFNFFEISQYPLILSWTPWECLWDLWPSQTTWNATEIPEIRLRPPDVNLSPLKSAHLRLLITSERQARGRWSVPPRIARMESGRAYHPFNPLKLPWNFFWPFDNLYSAFEILRIHPEMLLTSPERLPKALLRPLELHWYAP